ncbi:glycosyltransferase family 9 protein [Adhaeribacter radiodurans]|uniref:Glycosyltransferase family 9 protein n=1 Tax=Adhaeribacter radiodurans TaxID=2745197 RepID=A0A7L7LBU3_9BACT|nr:glycosyltransferase family 9 protein [Adhaeribacter radiodurans]QMU30312.1 glycosyltransferase family 9 protein [Adhaeribacter radiodurans]
MKHLQAPAKTILISRIDAIGDVVLTLPMAGWIKQHVPGARVLFLGRTYTAPVVACCRHIDEFLNWDDVKNLSVAEQVAFFKKQQISSIIHVFPNKQIAQLARKAGIKQRIGTRNRWFHWFTVNVLVNLSRRHSPYHESQLNFTLLRPLGLKEIPSLDEVTGYLDFSRINPLPEKWQKFLKWDKPRIILHPKSKGSAREWGLPHFASLAQQLHGLGWQVFISGSAAEGELLQDWLRENQNYITDVTGKFSLSEFISFMKACTGLVGASTGPLHLAASVGIHALGLYPPIKPMHPGRWAPLGPRAQYLVVPKDCSDCRKSPGSCVCIQQINVAQVVATLEQWPR